MIGIVMGSVSDWDTMKHAAKTLKTLKIQWEAQVLSAHRMPDDLYEYAENAKGRLGAIIAGAGGAAHLPGMLASKTTVPVLGVPIQSHALNGLDSLLSIVQMPAGITVGTFAIGRAGAVNAALFVAEWIAMWDKEVEANLDAYRLAQTIAARKKFTEDDLDGKDA